MAATTKDTRSTHVKINPVNQKNEFNRKGRRQIYGNECGSKGMCRRMMGDVTQRSGGDSSPPAPRAAPIQNLIGSIKRVYPSTSLQNLSSSSDYLCMLIRQALGYLNAGKAPLDRCPTIAPPEVCVLLLQEQFLQERSPTGSSIYRKAVSTGR